jgi:hypothetical protein
MPGGGKRPGAGRPKGVKNRSTILLEREVRALKVEKKTAMREYARKQARLLPPDVEPIEIILKVMRGDDTISPLQYQAAVAAAQYRHPKLTAVSAGVSDQLREMTDEQLDAELARLEAEAGAVVGGASSAVVSGGLSDVVPGGSEAVGSGAGVAPSVSDREASGVS